MKFVELKWIEIQIPVTVLFNKKTIIKTNFDCWPGKALFKRDR